MHLRTGFGRVALSVWHGKDPADGHWGCPMRERWGLSAHQQLSPALEDELGVFYRHEQAVSEPREQLLEKVLLGWQGEGLELGRRLHWEAQRGGLGRARAVPAVADGAPWIWNVVSDRWPGAHQLRHGKKAEALAELAALPRRRGERGKVIRREQNYFAEQAVRLSYQKVAQRGWPIASGAVESGCKSHQSRRKRGGQFWTAVGLRYLDALEEARDNGHGDEFWVN